MAVELGQIVKIQDVVNIVKSYVAAHIADANNGGTGSVNSGGSMASTQISWSGTAADVNNPVNSNTSAFLATKKTSCCTAQDVYTYVVDCMHAMCRVYRQNYQFWSSTYTNTHNGGQIQISTWYYGFNKDPLIVKSIVEGWANTNNKPVKGELISAVKLLAWMAEIANSCEKTKTAHSIQHGIINSCYSSCHSQCHGSSRGRR